MGKRPENQRNTAEAYQLAQRAMTDLKTAILKLLAMGDETGLRNADIGRSLGIYTGHEQHEGHIPRIVQSSIEG